MLNEDNIATTGDGGENKWKDTNDGGPIPDDKEGEVLGWNLYS